MNLGELIYKLEEMREMHGSDIEVRFEHELTLHEKSFENIEIFGFDDREILVI